MNDGLAATMRLSDSFKTLKDSAETFGTGLAKDLASGVPGVQALQNALKNLGQSLIESSVKSLIDQALSSVTSSLSGAAGSAAGATTSATILTAAGTTLAAQMIAGATSAAAILTGGGVAAGSEVAAGSAAGGISLTIDGASASIGLAAAGAGAGAAVAAGGVAAGASLWGPIAALAAAAAAIGLGSLLGGDDQQAAALKAAKDAWAGMTTQIVSFNAAAKGFDLGPLTQQLQSLYSQVETLQQAAIKANDFASAVQLAAQFNQAVVRISAEFGQGTQTLTPYAQALKALDDEAQGLEDTLNSLGYHGVANTVATELQQQTAALAQQYTDSLTSELQQRLNTADGKDYLNDAANLITQHAQDALEAQQLGMSMTGVNATFAAEAQKIVNDAGLVGSSFSDFIQLFPDFAGVVTQSATAIQAANDNFAALTKTINDYLDSLQLGSNSILSPQDQLNAAQSQFNAQLSLAQQGNTDALGSITQYASTLLDQAKGYYASSQGYTDVYNAVSDALKGLTTMPTPGLAMGGMVPGYAGGGVVGNGIYGRDSVRASYAGGGDIALAGGEFVNRAGSVNASTLPALQYINDNGSLPSGGSSGDFAAIGASLTRAMAGCSMAEINAINAGNSEIADLLRAMLAEMKSNKPRAPRPNAKAA
jgi:hypothetical protein